MHVHILDCMLKLTIFYNCLDSADSAYYSQDSRESECGANDDLFTVSKEKCTLKSADDGSNENDKDKNVCQLLSSVFELKILKI